MKILMYIGNDYIDDLVVEKSFLTIPGYVGRCVRLLKNKHKKLLAEINAEPEFLFSDPSMVKCCAPRPNP